MSGDRITRMVEIAGEIRGESASGLAWKFFDGVREMWLPKSQVTDVGEGCFEIPEWLATREGMI